MFSGKRAIIHPAIPQLSPGHIQENKQVISIKEGRMVLEADKTSVLARISGLRDTVLSGFNLACLTTATYGEISFSRVTF